MLLKRYTKTFGNCNTYGSISKIIEEEIKQKKYIMDNTSEYITYKLSESELKNVLKKYNVGI